MENYDDDFEICDCKSVTIGEVKNAILKNNLKTIEDISEWTDAGTACGCCKSKEDDDMDAKEIFLVDILEKHKED